MKYLCLIYDEEAKMATMSKSDADAFMGEYFAFTEGIKKSGHYLGGEALSRSIPRRRSGCGTARCRRPTAPSPRRRNSSAAST